GHPGGVEVTTGPLGQGFANAVGMAFAERRLRATYGEQICDHHTFVIAGDGDLMEGLSHEAASLAGHQKLGRLIAVYDDNHITIDGATELALSDDAPARFRAYGWHVIELGESANDLDALERALLDAKAEAQRPTLIVLRSHIGWPLPTKTDTSAAHGAITADDEIAGAKEALGLPSDETFFVPQEVVDYYRAAGQRGSALRSKWEGRLNGLGDQRTEYEASFGPGGLPGWESALPDLATENLATRHASNKCLQALTSQVPSLIAGAADLTGNTGTKVNEAPSTPESPEGRQLYFGVREHAMGAIMNGLALHGGMLPVGGTFLVFSDYMRPSIRLAAISGAHVIYSFTHDSVGVGEDGPTHQPVEHAAALRSIPGLNVIRPADGAETVAAWRVAVAHDGPTALLLTRQTLPALEGTGDGLARGAYLVREAGDAAITLIGSGSELQHCVAAADLLNAEGIAARVVSMPSWNLFEAQDPEYKSSVLPRTHPTLSIEAGVSQGWSHYADDSIAIDRFGASAPADRIMAGLGMTAENAA
ncbi:MAG: transketolase family protein, partial [Acidimicrobiales bacterium]